ncbi:MAG: rod shape-determining protein MreC [Candidatus Paralactobacillus gallistercoris]|uniref:Cell shape-determining protein MreC n=1 Tax=Candidatus Paralactobacillus gallistercoris TaxID=2838724 RepID=A0A948TK43_9LACO|nr:rod shape-determining protein MreC [Candidatus Paralactobacillus gallistercoris]
MKKFFSNKKLIVLMVALIFSIGFITMSVTVRNKSKTPSFIQRFGNNIVGAASRVISMPMNAVKSSVDAVVNLTNTYEENTKLKAQLDKLAQTEATNQTLRSENKQLKQQLKLDNTLTDYDYVNAAVMLRSPDNWQNILIINHGSDEGIQKNMSVMAGSGLVGRVVEVNRNNAKVELISTDNKSANRFAAQINTDKGVVNGIITGYDKKSGDLILGQINTSDGVKNGDKVITSGLGGSTPKGLLIGTVENTHKDDYGLSTVIAVKPAANLSDLSVVTIVKRSMAGD